jgi:hypothetical protein
VSGQQHPAVAYLTAELARVEETARAASGHQPYDEWEALGIDGDGDIARSIWEVPMIVRRWSNTPAARPIMEHIALHDPAAVLRRVAADREQLAEHADKSGACAVCVDRAHSGPGRWALIVYPCRTVLLLAQAWGWTEATT